MPNRWLSFPFWGWDSFARPGGKIGDTFTLVRDNFICLETHNVNIVFAERIWNMTIKRRHAGGIEIFYHRSDDNISCLVEEYDSIFKYF